MNAPLLRVEDLGVTYPGRAALPWSRPPAVTVVRGVSFEIARGETVALVGESGSGKTTVGRAILRLAPVSAGRIFFDGTEISALPRRALLPLRRRAQMVFQDPWHSLNPRQTIGGALSEPLEIHARELDAAGRRRRIAALLERVGLDPALARRHPHELSGGQRQRVGIARALAVNPDLLVCDEPVSALDVSVQAQVMALLRDLQRETGFAWLLISHDLAVVEQVSRRVLVMRAGEIVEQGETAAVFAAPRHVCTRELLDAVPTF
ncbi:MAG: ATP-binding cassette domain-containing protein [Puniceicoccales bacterium]|jgi:ABC-type glutathione transport system ATPase component|nr:ATP-binding cassette domain-containing protein [Puniceicoccales bacterium]